MTEISVSLYSDRGSTATRARTRGHELTIDRPESKGGSDQGPMGGELLLTALGGCFSSTLIAAAAAREVDLGELSVDVTAQVGQSPARFDSIELAVASTVCDPDKLAHLVELAHRGCLVANTLSRGVKSTARTVQLEHGP